MGICRLGYVGLDVTDVDDWTKLFQHTLGVGARTSEGGASGDRPILLELDEFMYRLALYPSGEDRPRHIGWIVDTLPELDRLCQRLEDAGFAVQETTEEEAATRGAVRLRYFHDPVGYRVELALGEAKLGTPPARPSDASPGVVGLGHLVLATPLLSEFRALYGDVLEFSLTDYRSPGLYFYRCNSTHHSIALADAPQASIHHLEIENGSLDDVGRALDKAEKNGVPISISLGRHMNDKAISFYVRNPSGFHLEIGFGGIYVGDDWVAHDFGTPDEWGHRHAEENPFARAVQS